MTDVFISYARKDKDFVRRLHGALQENGRKTWVDWESIPPSAEWKQEIYSAIERADAVIFVISPHSAASATCADEVAHAAKYSKRIIPLLREDVDEGRLPKAVRDRNWIFFKPSDEFDPAFKALSKALDTDLDWVRTHTRLLTRAIEWDGNRRDYSFALHGSDLQRAEACMTGGEERVPRLVPLQIEYILTSRRDTTRRRTVMFGSGLLALVAVLIFGLLFWQKRQESNLNIAASFRERGIFELANNNPLGAEVLLARALVINDTPDARQLLLKARARSSRLLWISPDLAQSTLVAISDDGTLFALRTKAGVEIWDTARRERVDVINTDKDIQRGAFSLSNRLVGLASDEAIEVWKLEAGAHRRLADIKATNIVSSVVFSTSGVLISGDKDGVISLWEAGDENQGHATELRGHSDSITNLAVSLDGRFLVSASSDDTVRVWDLLGKKETGTFVAHDDAVLCVAVSPDGELVASGGWGNTIWIWQLKTGTKLRALEGHTGSILNLGFSPDGKWLVSSSEDRTARVWEVERGVPVVVLPGHRSDLTTVAFVGSRGHGQLITGEADGIVRLWDVDSIGQRDELTTLRGHERPVTMIGFSPGRSMVISSSVDRTLRLWNLQTRRLAGVLLGHADNITALAVHPDGLHVASASRDATVRIWDIDQGEVVALWHAEKREKLYIRTVTYSPDGLLLASGADDGRIRIWDARFGRLLHDFAAHDDKLLEIAFTPDGKLLASAAGQLIKLWRVDDWTLARTLAGHRKGVFQIQFSPDGRSLLSASDDKTVRLWDVESGKELADALEHASPVWSVDFTADAASIVSGCEDWTVHLWRIETGAGKTKFGRHEVLQLADGPVWHVAFGQYGKEPVLGIAGQDRTIRVLNMQRYQRLFDDPQRLEAEAEQRSGLQVAAGSSEPKLVPIARERFVSGHMRAD